MHAVSNRIELERPLDDEVFAAAQRDLPERLVGEVVTSYQRT